MTGIPRERPIIYSGPMVRAKRKGLKSQTRRIIRGATGAFWDHGAYRPIVVGDRIDHWLCEDDGTIVREGAPRPRCPYGGPGTALWTRETWLPLDRDGWFDTSKPRTWMTPFGRPNGFAYRADTDAEGDQLRAEYGYVWKPSIHMPREACRDWDRVTDVRVERVQEISEDDAEAEGLTFYDALDWQGEHYTGYCVPGLDVDACSPRTAFAELWDSINGKRPGCSWADNPWVWAVTFARTEAPR